VAPAKDPQAFAKQLQSDILSAVLPLWGAPDAGRLPPGVLQSLLSVLNVCAQVGLVDRVWPRMAAFGRV
jgi:hypothetical protein